MFDLIVALPALPKAERILAEAPPIETPEPMAKPTTRKPGKSPAISDEIRAEHRHIAKNKHLWIKALRKSGMKGAAAYVVGLYLCECANSGTAKLYPKVETISKETGLPIGTVKGALSALKKAGLLYAKKPKFEGPPDYFLALPKDARKAENQSVRGDDEQSESRPTNGRDTSRRMAGRSSNSIMEHNHGKLNHGT